MTNKIYEKIKNIIKESLPFFLTWIALFFIFFYEFPYSIEAPGGTINVSNRIEVDNSYKSKGSLNMAYVTEFPSSIVFMLYAKLNSEWTISKEEDVVLENETLKDDQIRNKILLKEANSNAVVLAYTKANKKIKINDTKTLVTYVLENAKTDLKVGDEILKIENIDINNIEDVRNSIQQYNVNDEITIVVKNNGKEYIRKASIYEENARKYIGFVMSQIYEYEATPNIKIKSKASESGPSGGLMTTLAIYDKLVKEDITKGKKIVGTGTIDLNGNVGSIGGVRFKLAGAVKDKADIFLVPAGENYDEAEQIKKEKKYNIKIVPVSTFDEALNFLSNL